MDAKQDANPPRCPGACRTMPEVRAEIDRIDRALVALVAERQRYVERAGEIKEQRDAVHDEGRIADVLAKVVAEGERAGLSSAIAEPVWRILIERSIAHEFEIFDRKSHI
jgi:isochorismate pyruvate lyase